MKSEWQGTHRLPERSSGIAAECVVIRASASVGLLLRSAGHTVYPVFMRAFLRASLLTLPQVVLAFGMPVAAQAKCALPSPALSPPAGKVPPNPVLWLLLPAWYARTPGDPPRLRATAKGKSVDLRTQSDTSTESLRTYRIEVSASVAGPLTVELLDEQNEAVRSWSLTIDPAWRAAKSLPRPVVVGHEVSRWTCSHTRTRNLHFDAAAWAYRIVAAPSREALTQGRGQAFVVPRAMEQMWGYDAARISSKARLALGHANCFGPTFDWRGGAVFATVLALLPDGSEQPVTAAPLLLDPP